MGGHGGFGGGMGGFGGAGYGGFAQQPGITETVVNNYYDTPAPGTDAGFQQGGLDNANFDPGSNFDQGGVADADFDQGSDFGGGDFGGGGDDFV